MKIGFFDSGIGGITVLQDTLKILPNEDYIYYADTANVPYGPKPKDKVKKYIFDSIDFIVNQGVEAIVIACNTATSVAIEELRMKYNIPIIGMEPAVKLAIDNNKDKSGRILVTATALTLKENKLKNLIAKLDKEHIVDLLPLSKLVEFSEQNKFDESITISYIKEELSKYNLNDYKTVVLGCTHFSYYRNIIKEMVPSHISIIDGNEGTAKNLKAILENKNLLNTGNGSITFYNSGCKVDNKSDLNKYNLLLNRLKLA